LRCEELEGDGKILERLPRAGNSGGAAFNPATMEAFSTQGNDTMTIVKEKSPTTFEVAQDLKTWPSNGARTQVLGGMSCLSNAALRLRRTCGRRF
jgi:hypothetical protein